jgi:hypothetical protein
MNEDEEERRLLEQLKVVRARKAEKEAYKHIELLRDSEIKIVSKKITELEERILHYTIQRVEHLTRIEKIKRGEEDNLLTKEAVKKEMSIVQPKKENIEHQDKRERNAILRPRLAGLIKNPTHFRFNCKGRNHRCNTENGTTFVTPNGIVHPTLSAWTTAVLKECDSGGRCVSVYEVCEVWIDKRSGYVKWGDVYTSDCVSING